MAQPAVICTQVRDMPLGQFKSRFGGDISAVLLEDINRRIAASSQALHPPHHAMHAPDWHVSFHFHGALTGPGMHACLKYSSHASVEYVTHAQAAPQTAARAASDPGTVALARTTRKRREIGETPVQSSITAPDACVVRTWYRIAH